MIAASTILKLKSHRGITTIKIRSTIRQLADEIFTPLDSSASNGASKFEIPNSNDQNDSEFWTWDIGIYLGIDIFSRFDIIEIQMAFGLAPP